MAEKLQKSNSLLRRWAKAYNWKARVNAYDNSLEKKAHKKAVKTAEEVRQEHITIANALQHKALTALNELDPSELTPRDIKEMLKLAFEVQQSLILDKAASDDPANMSLSDFIDAAYKRRMEGGNDE